MKIKRGFTCSQAKTIKGIKILKGMTALSLLLAILSFFIILGCSVNMVEAKRGPPKEVEPVIYNNINYIAPHEKMGYVEAFNNTTGKKLWEIKVYDVKIDPNMETDVQWIFITNLSIVNGKLIVINEAGIKYEVDIEGHDAPPVDPIIDGTLPAAPTPRPPAEAVEPIKIPTASPTRTSTVIPTEKASGFEAVLAITILLSLYTAGQKRK